VASEIWRGRLHQNRVGSTFPECSLHVPALDRVVPGSRGQKVAVGAQRQPLREQWVLSYLVENAVKRSHLQGLMFGIGRAAVSYGDELVLHKVESDDPGAAGFVEMAADSIADALFEFGEG